MVLVTAPAYADVLKVPEGEPQPAITLPKKGTSMGDVEKKYGAPREKHAPAGGDTPKHPPITRWDYDAFYVFFEKDKVVDAVIPGAPPKIYHKDKLQVPAGATVVEEPAPAPAPAPTEAPAAAPAPATGGSAHDAPAPGISDKPRPAEPPSDAPPKEVTAPAKPPAAAE